MRTYEIELFARIDSLGDDATVKQGRDLVEWIIREIPRDYWDWAATEAIGIPGVYTDISMRLGECGVMYG